MKNLLLLIAILLFTACKSSALNPKYFDRKNLYPYVVLGDALLEISPGELSGKDYPPAGSPYWENLESVTNYGRLVLKLRVSFSNRGKILAYTNKAGGIFLNEDEVLVPPKELLQIIKDNPRFFEFYGYEDMLYGYTNFAECFPKEITNMEQIRENARILDQREKEYQIHEVKTIGDYDSKGLAGRPWLRSLETFRHYYVSPESSLRILQVLETYQHFLICMYSTMDSAGEDPYAVLPKPVLGRLAREISPALAFLPKDEPRKFYTAILNLMWFHCYIPATPLAELRFPWLFMPMVWEAEQRGLWEYWVQVPEGKRF